MRRRSVRRGILVAGVLFAVGAAGSALAGGPGNKAQPAQPRVRSEAGRKSPARRILKKRIAVLPIDVAVAPGGYRFSPRSIVAGVTDMLTSALKDTGRFIVVERARLEGVLGEQQLAEQGVITPETAPQRGKVLGAEYIVTGDLTEFEHQVSGAGSDIDIKGYRIGGSRERAHLAINARVVDVNTSEVLAAKRVSGTAVARAARLRLPLGDFDISTQAFKRSPLGKAMRSAVNKWVRFVVDELGSQPWEGRVAKCVSSTVYINGGRQIGIREGDKFEVLREGEALTDPATGLALAREIITVGSIRVTHAFEKYSVAEVLSGDGFERGDLVRAVGPERQQKPTPIQPRPAR